VPLPLHHDPEFPDYKPDPTLAPAQVDHLDVMTAVLDAVILLDGRIPAQGLLNLQGTFRHRRRCCCRGCQSRRRNRRY